MYDNILIISLDGLGTSDFEKIKDTDGFKFIIENGSYCKRVKSVYPSLTYPAHATIVTGKLPRNHGIINNTKVQPFRKTPDWYWYKKDLHGETIYDIARKMKKDVASFLWPVTGRGKIKYNLPEIFPNRPFQSQIGEVLKAGSPLFCADINNRFKHLRRGINQPYLDDFIHAASMYTFLDKNPYMTLIHYVDLDYMRHHKGFDSIEANEALFRYARRVKEWVDHLRNNDKLDTTLFIVLSDHFHKKVDKVIKPNVYLKELGLIKLLEEDIIDYKAYFKSCDGSGYIYINDKNDKELINKLRDELTVLSHYEENGIEFFIDSDKARTLGADSNALFMLEAMDGYYFSEDATGDFITDVSQNIHENEELLLSSHGYLPLDDDYRAVFLATGTNIKKSNELREMNLEDIAPTVAKLMGSSLIGVDGRVRYELINELY